MFRWLFSSFKFTKLLGSDVSIPLLVWDLSYISWQTTFDLHSYCCYCNSCVSDKSSDKWNFLQNSAAIFRPQSSYLLGFRVRYCPSTISMFSFTSSIFVLMTFCIVPHSHIWIIIWWKVNSAIFSTVGSVIRMLPAFNISIGTVSNTTTSNFAIIRSWFNANWLLQHPL